MPDQKVIENVSDTAFWVAYYRSRENERGDALFRDPFAKALVGERGKRISDSMPLISRYTEWSVISRTVIIDRFIEKLISEGVDTVINLGAGLDTRPYRMNLPETLEWIEVDCESIIAHKERILHSERPRCRLTRVAVDLANDRDRKAFFESAAPRAKKVLILTEGVIPYLSSEEVTGLAKDLFAIDRFAYWITEYFHPRVYRYLKETVRTQAMKNAPFKFYPDDWFGFFKNAGWAERETRYSGEIALEFKRRPPMPKWARLIFPFLPKKVREQSRRMAGYTIFARLVLLAIFLQTQAFGANVNLSCVAQTVESRLAPARFSVYAEDTLQGLEKMRNPETGLIRDKILLSPAARGGTGTTILNNNTSATNIGLDIVNQLGLLSHSGRAPNAAKNLGAILSSLEKMQYHRESGLFFSWYSTRRDLQVVNRDVSSVDNIHLALALWAIQEKMPNSELGRRASRLFQRMDFSSFYDAQSGLMGGNMKFDGKGSWKLESYRFANAGSEARSIYSLSWALGLLRKSPDPEFPKKAVKALKAEIFSWQDGKKTGRILKTWDGGAFQLLLPKLLINEEKYSPELAESFSSYARYIQAEGKRQGYLVPAAHSASNYGIDGDRAFTNVPSYEGKAGSPALVSSDHVDIQEKKNRERWDLVFTPHAAVIAASANPSGMAEVLASVEKIRSGPNLMYRPGWGFMDGYHVKGRYQGQVVPVQLSLDQGMIALALEQIDSKDGLSTTGRLLRDNPVVRGKLEEFYHLFDQKLSELGSDGRHH